MNYWNGLIMLVSVGTLLYITTMHMLPEVYGNSHSHSHSHGEIQSSPSHSNEEEADGKLRPKDEASRLTKVVTLLIGINAAFLLTMME